jgi:hypothetical protein
VSALLQRWSRRVSHDGRLAHLLQRRPFCCRSAASARNTASSPTTRAQFGMGRERQEFALWRRSRRGASAFSTRSTRRRMGCKPAAWPRFGLATARPPRGSSVAFPKVPEGRKCYARSCWRSTSRFIDSAQRTCTPSSWRSGRGKYQTNRSSARAHCPCTPAKSERPTRLLEFFCEKFREIYTGLIAALPLKIEEFERRLASDDNAEGPSWAWHSVTPRATTYFHTEG